MILFARLLSAAALAIGLAGGAAGATLVDRPSTLMFSGTAGYEISLADGSIFTVDGVIDGGLDFFASGFFSAGTEGEDPFGEDLSVLDPAGATVLNARGLAEIEIGAGFLAILFEDLDGDAASEFSGGLLLAIFRDDAFPALSGTATVELRRLNDLAVIPLPAAFPLLFAGLAALALAGVRRSC